jgi:aspartyl-tRNA(Asn)/glutamyl-tRNA(Gln) amidotransferase subunit C
VRISIEEVRRIARLAHLGLDPGGEERLRADLDQILAYVDNLNELDTTGIPEAAGPAGPGAPMRDDAAGSPLAPEAALANAPETGRGHFKVPRVLPG